MDVGLNLYSIRTLIGNEKDFLKTAIALKEQGYSYLQYSGATFQPDVIARVSRESGLAVTLTHVPADRIIGDAERLMEEHASFGCKNIGLGMMPIDCLTDEKKCKRKIGELERAAETMERNGFRFFYHNHHMEFLKYGGQTIFEYMIENAPHVNFTLDTYWVQYGGMDILSLLNKLDGRIGCVHLKDYRIVSRKNDKGSTEFVPAFAPLGDGTMEFKTIVPKMKSLGTEYFFVEQDDAVNYPDPMEQVKRSVDYAVKEL